jgi:DNA-binding ferritin-like protein
MQVTTDAKRPNEIANGLSKVLSETHALRLQTRDFQRKLRGPTCMTLRRLLVQQQDELRHAETELATRAREVRAPTHGAMPLEASAFATGDDTIQPVDERVMCLMDAHETAALAARSAHRLAEKAHDLRTCNLLARRTDVHEMAAWTLGSMYLASLLSCELCAARFTCPLSAVRLPARSAARGAEQTEAAAWRSRSR